MIESNFENLIKAYRKVAMTPEEKREVFKQSMLVIEKIEAVSLVHSDKKLGFNTNSEFESIEIDESINSDGKKGKWYLTQNFISYINRRQFIPALVASFLLLFTGGASLLAEQALPGDSLYSVKVNVNESLRDFTALTDEAKAKLAVEITEKRLQEAAVLSAQGNLNEENKKILQDQFIKRAEQIRNRVASLVSKNNLNAAQEVVVDFETALTTHELILESLSIAGGDTTAIAAAEPTSTSTETLAIAFSSAEGNTAIVPAEARKVVQKPEVASLLMTLKSELDTTKNSRINIQEKVMASIAASSSVNISGAVVSTQSLFESNIKELRYTIFDIQTELKSHSYSTTTVDLVNKRLVTASSSVYQIENLVKNNQLAEATELSRQALKNLAEVQVVLKVEKNTKEGLEGKLDVNLILGGNTAGLIDPNTNNSSSTASTTASTTDQATATTTDGTIVQ